MTLSKGFIYNVPHSVRPHTARKTYWLQLSEINQRVSLETNTNVLKTTLAGFICYYYSIQSNCDRKGCTGNESETFQRRTKRTCSPWTPQSAFIHSYLGFNRSVVTFPESRSTEQDCVMAKSAEPGREKMGRREGAWKGMQGWIRPPPGTYDYITFGPVTLRTSDLSPIILTCSE